MTAGAPVNGSFVNALFNEEPPGRFAEGYVFRAEPDMISARRDPDNGYWHCNIANEDRLTWSEKVYELFGLNGGSPVAREWAVARYSEESRSVLERVRKFGLSRDFGFIIDAEIQPETSRSRWIRVLAVPILEDRRVVALHGVKRAI